MTGVEQAAVWLFGIFCVSVTVAAVVKAWTTARVDVAKLHAKAHVDTHRVIAAAQHGPLTVPLAWSEQEEL